jgi:trimeric autotransporter adhesin
VIAGTPAATAVVGQAYAFQPAASDPDGDRLVFRASGVPGWAKFDKRTGRLHGSPAKRHLGKSHSILISVTDGQLQASLPRFTLTVAASAPGVAPTPVDPPPPTVPPPTGSPPSIGGTPPASVVEGELYGFVPTASDPDGDALHFSISGKPAWATFSASIGPAERHSAGGFGRTYSQVQISVSDGSSTASLPAVRHHRDAEAEQPARDLGHPGHDRRTRGEAYSFRPSASDPEGQALQFAVEGLPAWASFDTASGTLRGTPTWSHAGTYAASRSA